MLHMLLLVLTSVFIGPAHASPENPFRVTAQPLNVAAGAEATAQVTFHVPPGTYLYKEMTSVVVANPGGLEAGEASLPPALVKEDPATGLDREVWDMDAVAEVSLKAPTKAGEHELLLEVNYQGCKGSLCYMPVTELIPVPVTVAAEKASLLDVLVGTAHASQLSDENPITVSTRLEGDVIVADVKQYKGWHATQMMTAIELKPPEDTSVPAVIQLCKQTWPPAIQRPDPAIPGSMRGEFDGDFVAKAEIAGPEGTHTVTGWVAYQACKADKCLLPQYADFEFEVTLDGSRPVDEEACAWSVEEVEDAKKDEPSTTELADFSGDEDTAGGAAPSFGGDAFAEARAKGILPLLALVFGAGFLVSLTPCVLPMVPITMGIIGAESSGNRGRAIFLACMYVVGLAVVYTALGVFAGLTGSIFGGWMQSPWVVGGVGLFFVAMAFAMFGFYEVGVPSALASKLNDKGGAGPLGAFIVGAVGAVVAGPCSGPVIASLMVVIGQQGEILLGAFLMMAFSLGMGTIFIAAGVAGDALLRPGAWMDTVKKGFGVAMLIAATWFVSAHIGETLTTLSYGLILLITANFAWPQEYDDGLIVGAKRSYGVFGNLVGAMILLGVLQSAGFGPQFGGGGGGGVAAEAEEHVIWSDDHDGSLALAAEQGKPIIIDFTADWCAACKELEHFTYTDAEVIATSEQFVTVMIDATDKKDPVANALLEKYDVKGLPTVLFLHPDGTVRDELTLTGFEPADKFLPRMQAALD